MKLEATQLIIFTDLDGCLLNKHDYDWSPAARVLNTLRDRKIPVVMNSSKTVAEMRQLATELGLSDATFVSENGSVIRWGVEVNPQAGEIEIVAASHAQILRVLADLKSRFRFRSFADLGLSGLVDTTQLSEEKATLAMQRQGTEPLLWDDTDDERSVFEQLLSDQQLSLTKGGRFWHVAGQTSKGIAMRMVADRFAGSVGKTTVAAIGDSPIDQSMLDMADVPIGISTPSGLGVTVDPARGIVARSQGSAGWAEAVTELLKRFDGSKS